jgi:hypothetical protein
MNRMPLQRTEIEGLIQGQKNRQNIKAHQQHDKKQKRYKKKLEDVHIQKW